MWARREEGHDSLAFPEEVVDPAPGPELMIDPADGEPLLLFGRTIVIDERIKKFTKEVKRKHARAKAVKEKTRRAKDSWSRAGRRSPWSQCGGGGDANGSLASSG